VTLVFQNDEDNTKVIWHVNCILFWISNEFIFLCRNTYLKHHTRTSKRTKGLLCHLSEIQANSNLRTIWQTSVTWMNPQVGQIYRKKKIGFISHTFSYYSSPHHSHKIWTTIYLHIFWYCPNCRQPICSCLSLWTWNDSTIFG
jgi:hypothetical protein